MSSLAELEAEVAELRRIVDVLTGNLSTPGNIMQVGERAPSDPLKHFLGPTPDRGFYVFAQQRFPDQGGPFWAGFETFERVSEANPAWGYGRWPGRIWFQNLLFEANGAMVLPTLVAQRIYLQQPLHRNLATGEFQPAHHYDAQGVPYTETGEELGGIYWDTQDLGVRIERVGDRVLLFAGDKEVQLA